MPYRFSAGSTYLCSPLVGDLDEDGRLDVVSPVTTLAELPYAGFVVHLQTDPLGGEPDPDDPSGTVDLRVDMASGPADVEAGGMTTFSRSEEHTSELQSLMRISYAVFCLKKKKK